VKVKMILPALTEATSPFWRPIKYSLFPPLGLATLAGYLGDDDEVGIQDEHVERLDLYARLAAQDRITIRDWDVYDTRHAVYRPARMSAEELERGYRRAYRDFYRWGSILRGASTHETLTGGLRHFAYAAGWKKFEPCWDLVIRAKRAGMMLPVLETILSEFGRRRAAGGGPSVSSVFSLHSSVLRSAGLRASGSRLRAQSTETNG
jgi:hypothetical protein